MTKFKVGDRVRTTRTFDEAPAGAEGTIQSTDPRYYIRVTLDNCPYTGLYSAWPFQANELELIGPDPRDDALDRIANVLLHEWVKVSDDVTYAIYKIIRETGRMQ